MAKRHVSYCRGGLVNRHIEAYVGAFGRFEGNRRARMEMSGILQAAMLGRRGFDLKDVHEMLTDDLDACGLDGDTVGLDTEMIFFE